MFGGGTYSVTLRDGNGSCISSNKDCSSRSINLLLESINGLAYFPNLRWRC